MVDATPLSIEELGSIRSKIAPLSIEESIHLLSKIARHGDAVVISDELFERLIASCEQSFVRPMSIAPTDGRKVLLEWPFWSKDYVIGSYTNNGWWSDCVLTGDGPGPTGWIPLPKAAT